MFIEECDIYAHLLSSFKPVTFTLQHEMTQLFVSGGLFSSGMQDGYATKEGFMHTEL